MAGTITNTFEQTGDGAGADEKYIVPVVFNSKAEARAAVPKKHSGNPYGGPGYLVGYRISQSGPFYVLNLTYSIDMPDVGMTSLKEGKSRFRLEPQNIEKPISNHWNYVYCWDHYLVANKNDYVAKPSAPGGYDMVGDDEAAEALLGNDSTMFWRHKSETCDRKLEWKVTVPKKPKVDCYADDAPCVVEEFFYRNYTKACNHACSEVCIKAPEKTFRRGNDFWICYPSAITDEGKYWLVTTRYQFCRDYDEEIYA